MKIDRKVLQFIDEHFYDLGPFFVTATELNEIDFYHQCYRSNIEQLPLCLVAQCTLYTKTQIFFAEIFLLEAIQKKNCIRKWLLFA